VVERQLACELGRDSQQLRQHPTWSMVLRPLRMNQQTVHWHILEIDHLHQVVQTVRSAEQICSQLVKACSKVWCTDMVATLKATPEETKEKDWQP